MVLLSNSGNRHGSRIFVIVVTILWIIALVSAVALIWLWQTGSLTPETTTTLAPTTTEAPTTTAAPTTTEAPTTTTTLPPALTVSAGGDVMGDRKVGTFLDESGGAAAFAGVKRYFEDAHLAFVNLEGAISDAGTRNTAKEYTFRARPALLDGLTSAGIDVVSLANNHILDYRWAALDDCISRLDKAGVKHAGAGGDLSEASTPAMLDTPAGKVAVIGVSQITSSFAATSKNAGTYHISSSKNSDKGLSDKIAQAKSQADFVIVSLHWGVEYKTVANAQQIALAHSLVDAGADLILGHHPHVVQGLEIYKDRLIVYSMGDFVFDHFSRITGEAFVLQVSVPRDGTAPWGKIIPVYLTDSHGIPEVVTGKAAKTIIDRLTSLSAKRDLVITADGDVATFGSPPAGDPADTGEAGAPGASTTSVPGTTTTTL